MADVRWRLIPGLENFWVSECGDIKNGKTNRLLKPNTRDGYKRVNMRNAEGKFRCVYNHRAVLLAFVGEPPVANWHAAHRNGNCFDNRLENLRWCSPKENCADRFTHGTVARGERHGNSKLKDGQIREIHAARAAGLKIRAIADRFGVAHSTVSVILSGHFRQLDASGAPICAPGEFSGVRQSFSELGKASADGSHR